MYCKSCGEENIDDAKFCKKCGTPLEQVAAQQQAAAQQQQAGAQQATYQQQATQQQAYQQQTGYQQVGVQTNIFCPTSDNIDEKQYTASPFSSGWSDIEHSRDGSLARFC